MLAVQPGRHGKQNGGHVSIGFLIAITGLIFGWSVLSGRMEGFDVTGPILFVAVGLVLCNGPLELLSISVETTAVHQLTEATLAFLLFADASRVDVRNLRGHAGVPIRLLVMGLPLTLALGFGLAAALFTEIPWELAALLGAVLAPTDASLSAAVVSNPALPKSIRRSLNLESGLNDGIVTPLVTGLLAASATVIGVGAIEDTASGHGGAALIDLGGGIAAGVAVGYLGGQIVTRCRTRGWIAPGGRRVAVLMLPAMAFAISKSMGVNYFVAAFVAGLAFRAAVRKSDEEATELPELLGRVLSLTVWFVFGAALLVDGLELVDWRIALYAILSLTVVRMLPVAVAMIGTRSGASATAFIGWFGPRGLASVVFGVLIVEELPTTDPGVQTVLSVTVLTILLSVVAHGITGRPLTRWMAQQTEPTQGSTLEGDER